MDKKYKHIAIRISEKLSESEESIRLKLAKLKKTLPREATELTRKFTDFMAKNRERLTKDASIGMLALFFLLSCGLVFMDQAILSGFYDYVMGFVSNSFQSGVWANIINVIEFLIPVFLMALYVYIVDVHREKNEQHEEEKKSFEEGQNSLLDDSQAPPARSLSLNAVTTLKYGMPSFILVVAAFEYSRVGWEDFLLSTPLYVIGFIFHFAYIFASERALKNYRIIAAQWRYDQFWEKRNEKLKQKEDVEDSITNQAERWYDKRQTALNELEEEHHYLLRLHFTDEDMRTLQRLTSIDFVGIEPDSDVDLFAAWDGAEGDNDEGSRLGNEPVNSTSNHTNGLSEDTPTNGSSGRTFFDDNQNLN